MGNETTMPDNQAQSLNSNNEEARHQESHNDNEEEPERSGSNPRSSDMPGDKKPPGHDTSKEKENIAIQSADSSEEQENESESTRSKEAAATRDENKWNGAKEFQTESKPAETIPPAHPAAAAHEAGAEKPRGQWEEKPVERLAFKEAPSDKEADTKSPSAQSTANIQAVAQKGATNAGNSLDEENTVVENTSEKSVQSENSTEAGKESLPTATAKEAMPKGESVDKTTQRNQPSTASKATASKRPPPPRASPKAKRKKKNAAPHHKLLDHGQQKDFPRHRPGANKMFDASTLHPVRRPCRVPVRPKKIVELVENSTNEVIVCFAGLTDACHALDLNRSIVKRCCEDYDAGRPLSLGSFTLRYLPPNEPLKAYRWGSSDMDFKACRETHAERMIRFRKSFELEGAHRTPSITDTNHPIYNTTEPSLEQDRPDNKNEEEEERDPTDAIMTCILCQEQDVETIFEPCRHALLCIDCAETGMCRKYCPLCHTPIASLSEVDRKQLIRPRIYSAYSFL